MSWFDDVVSVALYTHPIPPPERGRESRKELV
jgi:hypothetical protein